MSAKTFEFEGESYTAVTSPNDITMDEMDAVLEWLVEKGLDADISVLRQPVHRVKMLRILAWASINRVHPEFSLFADSGRIDIGGIAGAMPTPRDLPKDHQAPGAVLSPTKPASRPTRRRAAPK
jgi:hypothetical protein